ETIHIPEADLSALSQESLENPQGIERLEKAAITLYKALLSTRDTSVGDMAAASERVGEYRTKAGSFCKRIFDFLAIMFKFQVENLSDPKNLAKTKERELPSHSTMEDFLGRYCGLMLFVKEIDYTRYQHICAFGFNKAYFTSMSDLHRTEIHSLMASLRGKIRKTTDEEHEASFSGPRESPTMRQQSMRRVGTVVRNPLESGGSKRGDQSGKITGSEAFKQALSQIIPRINREQGFISDFLAINTLDASITFADYMQLETYFRRGAMGYLASQQGKLKDIKSAMDLVWGFLEAEMRDWADQIVRSDSMQIVGVLVALDKAIIISDRERNEFLLRTLHKQYQKSTGVLERFCKEQIKTFEQTKLTLKKRKGVVPFVRHFPLFVKRVESQLVDADDLKIRLIIDANYDRMVSTIFDCLQQMAKMDGEGQGVAAEDKDQLNYHVIIIENMHHIVTVFGKENIPPLAAFVGQAREKYTQNLDLYIKLILRRPLARLLRSHTLYFLHAHNQDFFHGLEQLLRTTPPTEVSLHGAYTKSALKRTISDLRAKDLRKAIDALYKRVDKHFGDVLNPSAEHSAVIKEVWKACEVEVQRLTSAWKSLMERCYPDEKVGFEFSRDDVHDYYLKARAV
ncbi:exocyst complex component 1, partial [Phenoliferia sp. Uapishka_3]